MLFVDDSIQLVQRRKALRSFVCFFVCLFWLYSLRCARATSFARFLDHTDDAPQSGGLLWTSDQPVAETST